MKTVSVFMKIAVIIMLLTALTFAAVVLILTVTDYRPAHSENIERNGKGTQIPAGKYQFSFLSWNIGYAGLGENMDFFYEGGKRVRPEKPEFTRYMMGISDFLQTMDTVNFIFIQEADVHSKRSYFTDEVAAFAGKMEQRCYLFAKNYDSRFVPLPLFAPMGRVVSGIACYTQYKPWAATRIDLRTRFSWPKQLAMLKRCLMVMRYNLDSGREMVVINLHNSTFDKGGELRKKELSEISEIMLHEYSKGNYVVAGGDWNTNPRGYQPSEIQTGDLSKIVEPAPDSSFLPSWHFVFDHSKPSNRDVDMPYVKGKSKTTTIDFFVVSPNIDAEYVSIIPNEFRYSDHQPVYMKVRLK